MPADPRQYCPAGAAPCCFAPNIPAHPPHCFPPHSFGGPAGCLAGAEAGSEQVDAHQQPLRFLPETFNKSCNIKKSGRLAVVKSRFIS